MTSLTQTNETTIMTRMTNNELIDEAIVILQTTNGDRSRPRCAAAIEELRNELERVKGIARDRLATIAELRRPISDFGMEDAFHAEVSDCGMEDELEASLSPAGDDGLYGAYLRGELGQ